MGGDGSSGTDDQCTSGTWPKNSCAFCVAAAPEEDDDKERRFGEPSVLPSFPLSACKWTSKAK